MNGESEFCEACGAEDSCFDTGADPDRYIRTMQARGRARILAELATALHDRVAETRRTLGEDAAQAIREAAEDLERDEL